MPAPRAHRARAGDVRGAAILAADKTGKAAKVTAEAATVAAVETAEAGKTAALKTRDFLVGKKTSPAPQTPASDDVRRAQELLKKEGFYKGDLDGKWGPATEQAVREYQAAKRLPVTGELDAETRKALGFE